jgi:transcriptional regulator with XRE-family HTH domain
LSTQLLEGGGPGGRNLFSGARGADNIRFWFDVERGLEKKLDDLLTKDERSRLDTLRGRVRSVIPTWVAARRETLALTQQKLGDLTEIPFAEIVRIETEIGAINPITLAAIEKAFMARAVEIELNEIGDPSEPHDPELVVSDSAMGKALRAAGIPLNGFAAEPGPKTGEVPVRAAAANGGELAPLPAITSGNDVRTLRRRLGVSQKVLADAAGVNETVMSNVETGKREINPDIQLRLGIALENLAGAQGQTLT